MDKMVKMILDGMVLENSVATGISLPLEVVKVCGGYYECPKGADGKRLGPLVGYAGRDNLGQQYVGDIYVNFAAVERYAVALGFIAKQLHQLLKGSTGISDIDVYCGAPEGGKALATILSVLDNSQYIFPEKKVTAVATRSSREESDLVFSRHEPLPGERVVIVEDVCNNFSTTEALVDLIEKHEARCVGIVCFLNRSKEFSDQFVSYASLDGPLRLPVVSLVRNPFLQYQQSDVGVADDIAAGNVVWKPKNEWYRLAEAMNQ